MIRYQYFFGKDHFNGASLVNATADKYHMATVAAINNAGVGPESHIVHFTTAQRGLNSTLSTLCFCSI